MIEFNYKIVRDEGDEKKIYTPAITKQLHDLIYIEGPNSSGKSTLLHILALGLFGLKNKNIRDSLQKKLRDLSGSGHQEVTFSFSIKNDLNNLQITSEKKNPLSKELAVFETIDGKRSPLTLESFERKYNLIYDIPDDPLERLDELTKELKDRQIVVGRGVGELKIQLRDTIKEVQSSQDPKKLEEFRRQLKTLAKSISDLETEKRNLENDRLLLKRYYTSKYFLEYKKQLKDAENAAERLEEARKGLQKKEKTNKRKVKSLVNESATKYKSIETAFVEVTFSLKAMNIKTKEDFLSVWRTQDLKKLFLEKEKHSILFKGIMAFRDKLQELDLSIGDDGKLEEATFLDDLIHLLQHYSGVKTTLPGTEKTIPEFIAVLEKRFRECKEIKGLHDKYAGVLAKLGELETNSRTFIDVYLPELETVLVESKNNQDDQDEDIQQDIEQNNLILGRVGGRIEYFRDEMIRSGVNEKDAESIVTEIESRKHLRPYSTYDEQELEAKLKDLQDEIDNVGKRIKENEYIKSRHEHEIHRLEQQEPHKYQHRLDELQEIFAQVQILEQKLLKEFDENLKGLMSQNVRKSELTKSQLAYFDAVAVYLGRKVVSIRHIDKEYTVKKIDLVDRKVFTQSGKTIMLTDLGTGQSQSAYLKGLLNSNDKRKVIALIDEVAMMDSDSMKPIYELLRKKYNNGTLLAGIVVQKGESLMVKPIP